MHERIKNTTQFAILYFLSRFFSLLAPGFSNDFYEYAVWGDALLQGHNIYEEFQATPQGLLTLKYPPLFFVQCALILLIFGYYSWSIRIGFIIYETIAMFALYRFSVVITKERGLNRVDTTGRNLTVLYIYAFSPITILNLILGQPWTLGAVFLTAGLLAFYMDKVKLMGIFICLGFLTQYYPIFCLVPILIFYFSRAMWKQFWQLILSFSLTFIIICLPFILLDPNLFVVEFFIHFARVPQTISVWGIMEDNFQMTSWNIFGIFTINPLSITFITFVAIFSITSYYIFKRQKEVDKFLIFYLILIFYISLPFVFLSFDIRYFYWSFPLSALLFSISFTSLTSKNKVMGLLSTFLTAVFGLFFLLTQPTLLTTNQTVAPSSETIKLVTTLGLGFFALSIPFYLCGWYILGNRIRITSREFFKPTFHQVITVSQGVFLIGWALFVFNLGIFDVLLFLVILFLGFALNLKSLLFLIKSLRARDFNSNFN